MTLSVKIYPPHNCLTILQLWSTGDDVGLSSSKVYSKCEDLWGQSRPAPFPMPDKKYFVVVLKLVTQTTNYLDQSLHHFILVLGKCSLYIITKCISSLKINSIQVSNAS